MKNIKTLFFLCSIGISSLACAQEKFNYPGKSKQKVEATDKITYTTTRTYPVQEIASKSKAKRPKNIIVMISDGTGTSQFFTAIAANNNQAYIEQMPITGFSKTASKNKFTTDSAAGGSAIATGHKSNNGEIGLDENGQPAKTLLEMCDEQGKSTGLIATSSITHATPASFIAHQPSRKMNDEIAADFMKTDIDVFIGGGKKHFGDRKDGKDLLNELDKKGYKIAYTIDEVTATTNGKLAGLLADNAMPPYTERGDVLPNAANTAVKLLNQNKEGFFLMVEGSQVDWGGHNNNTELLITEMQDFDYTLGEMLKFAEKDGETLIVVTADHETGGFSVNGGDPAKNTLVTSYTSTHHTATMVPVFAYGPGAEEFSGIYENTEIAKKIMKLMKLK
ncbi:alkaline phosphatase [Flammeovirga kamogawensis]|uniref:Alkaline phosphatase n=1 Tax=Flammeovirga kamogawensis TaxID=373891 RepID=A0ABX8H178_9BACT|nr:alkaline phosphatase [Flammeovirga kamogawensis]MBB6462615.1 alkaline phosphatase [Flammeovirga kamogawensis]QWG09640.1 alkaline phosphatase [Flammeovirga kamogawensis]